MQTRVILSLLKKEFAEFINFCGLRGCYDSEVLACFEDETALEGPKPINSKSIPAFSRVENAHIEINNYSAPENASQPKASAPHTPQEQTEIPEEKESEKETKRKNRSRSSDDRELAITLTKTLIEQRKSASKFLSLHKSAQSIQNKLGKKYELDTIKNWIRGYFPDEAKKRGRPSKNK